MSRLSRIVNIFRATRVEDELDEELRFHVEEARRRSKPPAWRMSTRPRSAPTPRQPGSHSGTQP